MGKNEQIENVLTDDTIVKTVVRASDIAARNGVVVEDTMQPTNFFGKHEKGLSRAVYTLLGMYTVVQVFLYYFIEALWHGDEVEGMALLGRTALTFDSLYFGFSVLLGFVVVIFAISVASMIFVPKKRTQVSDIATVGLTAVTGGIMTYLVVLVGHVTGLFRAFEGAFKAQSMTALVAAADSIDTAVPHALEMIDWLPFFGFVLIIIALVLHGIALFGGKIFKISKK